MPRDPQIVAVAYDLNFKHAAEIFSGVSDYIRERGLNWQLLPLNFGFEAKLMELSASGRLSGAIGTFVSDEWIGGLRAQGVSAVNLFNFSRIESAPTVCLNDIAIGKDAATHLLEQGAKNLAFIGQDQAYFTQIRRDHFSRACPEGRFHPIPEREPRRLQAERLRAIDGPVGVLCSTDRIARELTVEANLLEMKIGAELLVMGIGNDPTESTFAGVGLSSFEIPAREIGYSAASKMEALLDSVSTEHQQPDHETVKAKLVSRESTLSSPQARLVERALAIIDESISKAEFDIAELCRKLGVSRRVLELNTKRQLGKSPYQLLSAERLRKAKTLLLKTNQTISKIGEACGYPEPHHFSAWFKQRTTLAPRSFRDQKRET